MFKAWRIPRMVQSLPSRKCDLDNAHGAHVWFAGVRGYKPLYCAGNADREDAHK